MSDPSKYAHRSRYGTGGAVQEPCSSDGEASGDAVARGRRSRTQEIRARGGISGGGESAIGAATGAATGAAGESVEPEAWRRNQKFGGDDAGRTPREIIAEAKRRGNERRNQLVEESGPHFTIRELAAELDWTVAEVRRAIDERRLYAVKSEEGETLLPEWQVESGEPIDGLEEVLQKLPHEGWVADLIFFESGHFLLEGKTPAEALAAGEMSERVLRAAGQEGRHGAA